MAKSGVVAEALERGEHDRRPAVIGRAGARVDGEMVGVVAVTALAGRDHHADLDRAINRLHQIEVIPGARGVGVGIVGHGVAVGFPGAVAFVADFPILEAERRGPGDAEEVLAVIMAQRRGGAQRGPVAHGLPVGSELVHAEGQGVGGRAVGIGDPGGGFIGAARAVVDRDDGLRADIGGDMDEIGKRGRPRPGVGEIGAGAPMIFIRERAAGATQHPRAHLLQQRNGGGRVEIAVPNGGVDRKPARIHRRGPPGWH